MARVSPLEWIPLIQNAIDDLNKSDRSPTRDWTPRSALANDRREHKKLPKGDTVVECWCNFETIRGDQVGFTCRTESLFQTFGATGVHLEDQLEVAVLVRGRKLFGKEQGEIEVGIEWPRTQTFEETKKQVEQVVITVNMEMKDAIQVSKTLTSSADFSSKWQSFVMHTNELKSICFKKGTLHIKLERARSALEASLLRDESKITLNCSDDKQTSISRSVYMGLFEATESDLKTGHVNVELTSERVQKLVGFFVEVFHPSQWSCISVLNLIRDAVSIKAKRVVIDRIKQSLFDVAVSSDIAQAEWSRQMFPRDVRIKNACSGLWKMWPQDYLDVLEECLHPDRALKKAGSCSKSAAETVD
jgi:hypothetical protein